MAAAEATVERVGTLLRLRGRLDRASVAAVWPQALAALDGVQGLDLHAVEALDSAGLALLAELADRLPRAGTAHRRPAARPGRPVRRLPYERGPDPLGRNRMNRLLAGATLGLLLATAGCATQPAPRAAAESPADTIVEAPVAEAPGAERRAAGSPRCDHGDPARAAGGPMPRRPPSPRSSRRPRRPATRISPPSTARMPAAVPMARQLRRAGPVGADEPPRARVQQRHRPGLHAPAGARLREGRACAGARRGQQLLRQSQRRRWRSATCCCRAARASRWRRWGGSW